MAPLVSLPPFVLGLAIGLWWRHREIRLLNLMLTVLVEALWRAQRGSDQ